jgi:hypothetical protein
LCAAFYSQEKLLSEENEDELIEKYKARRWLVRVTRKNLRWEIQQKLFGPYEGKRDLAPLMIVLSFQELIGLVLENNWEIMEDIDLYGMFRSFRV